MATTSPKLVSVSELPDPPYSSAVKSNGFKQEIDLDRILSSRTWTLADNECKPWLLMLWALSWRNVPCGTWENDDEYIAASIGCKFEWFQGHRSMLMRGWVKHSDGLLYHQFISSQVLEMLGRRRATSDRVKKYRQLQETRKQEVTVSNALQFVTYAKEQDQEQEQVKNIAASQLVPSPPFAESEPTPKSPPCPYEKIRSLWVEICPGLTRPLPVENWTPYRKSLVRSRWAEELPDLDAWAATFRMVARSHFLTGKVQRNNTTGKPWQADLFWTIKLENLSKLYEGKYENA